MKEVNTNQDGVVVKEGEDTLILTNEVGVFFNDKKIKLFTKSKEELGDIESDLLDETKTLQSIIDDINKKQKEIITSSKIVTWANEVYNETRNESKRITKYFIDNVLTGGVQSYSGKISNILSKILCDEFIQGIYTEEYLERSTITVEFSIPQFDLLNYFEKTMSIIILKAIENIKTEVDDKYTIEDIRVYDLISAETEKITFIFSTTIVQ